MPLPTLQPKDALVLCTVTILFVYFGLILWTNYAIIIPFWTPLFWAAALSVPLHALKSSLVPVLHEALEQDIMDIVASVIGGIVTFVLRFFLGSFITNGIRTVFLGYCYIVYMICDGRPRKENSPNRTKENGTATDAFWERNSKNTTEHNELDRIDEEDDYELHPNYQVLVEQEPDNYARPANWPSYLNLLRAAFIYGLLQLGTPAELWSFAKSAWDGVQFGTQRQLNFLLVAVLLHIQYSCLGQIVAMLERIAYPNLTPEEQREQSILNTVPRMIRKAVQESLNSTVAAAVVFLTLAVVGSLTAILSIGVAHDIQGLVSQTHHRVIQLRDHHAHLLQDATGDNPEHVTAVKSSWIQQADNALVQAYEAGLDWFDPILKDAFPSIAWSAAEWASEVAHIVVDLNANKDEGEQESKCQVNETNQADFHAVMAMHDLAQSAFNGSSASSGSTCNSAPTARKGYEEPEFWVLPTLESLGIPRIRTHEHGFQLHTAEKQRAINISQAKYLLNVVLGYKGLNTESMLNGFNVFNDLLFRGILFLLGLVTFTGLKVSPLQRLGWLIDQALVSSPSSFGSLQLSTSASPGRVLAKSIEFSISGTFIAMFKLSVYHTIFTVTWTYLLADRVLSQVAIGTASSDFVVVKYAWLTSLAGIVLTLFPIAPNWLVSLPGAIIHFYVFGQRPTEAIAMAVGHLLLSNLVDGVVWDSHVVKNARPGVSSAFWLGLWIFLGGMKWGTKGLLMGPVLFAAVPSIWSAILELRGRPWKGDSASGSDPAKASLAGSQAHLRRLSAGEAATSKDEQVHQKENGFRRFRDQELDSEDDAEALEAEEVIETLRYRGSSRANSVGRGTPSGRKSGYRS